MGAHRVGQCAIVKNDEISCQHAARRLGDSRRLGLVRDFENDNLASHPGPPFPFDGAPGQRRREHSRGRPRGTQGRAHPHRPTPENRRQRRAPRRRRTGVHQPAAAAGGGRARRVAAVVTLSVSIDEAALGCAMALNGGRIRVTRGRRRGAAHGVLPLAYIDGVNGASTAGKTQLEVQAMIKAAPRPLLLLLDTSAVEGAAAASPPLAPSPPPPVVAPTEQEVPPSPVAATPAMSPVPAAGRAAQPRRWRRSLWWRRRRRRVRRRRRRRGTAARPAAAVAGGGPRRDRRSARCSRGRGARWRTAGCSPAGTRTPRTSRVGRAIQSRTRRSPAAAAAAAAVKAHRQAAATTPPNKFRRRRR